MENKYKITIIVVVVTLVIIAGAGFWYWSQRKAAVSAIPFNPVIPLSELSTAEAEDTLGGQILGKTQNPLKGELPPVNPFEKIETNPLKDVYVNPF
ncbi:MAG: hypothetical protein HYT37_04300 [Candidatus Sungbacteria bacterium]|nr:hypothetical protein [Candidatus Sungbacteria bacterium]